MLPVSDRGESDRVAILELDRLAVVDESHTPPTVRHPQIHGTSVT